MFDDLYMLIIPDTHPSVAPVSKAETGAGFTTLTVNEEAISQAEANAPPTSDRKRKAEIQMEISSKILKLMDRELSSDAAPVVSQKSFTSGDLELAKAQKQSNMLKAMELVKGLTPEEIQTMKNNAELLLQ